MTLPISSVVDVTISVAPTAPPAPGFGVAAIVSDELDINGIIVPSLRVTYFGSITEVANVYDALTATYIAANTYFSQSPRPDELSVIVQNIVDAPASLVGRLGTDSNISPWNAITAGEFSLTLGGLNVDVTGLDFSGAINMVEVAAIIEIGLQAIATGAFTTAICTWDNGLAQLTITSGEDGTGIGYMAPALNPISLEDISLLSQLDAANASALIQGTAIETPVQALTAAELFDNNWYGVILLAKHRDSAESTNVANWVQSRIKVYSACTNNPNTLIPGNTSHMAYTFFNTSLSRAMVSYSSTPAEYPDIAALGEAFTTNFNVPNSVITLKFKIFEGITPEDLTSIQKGALDDVRANASIRIGQTSMFAEGTLSSALFFDERHSIDWLQGRIETNVFNYLSTRLTKVPLTDAGGASLEQQVIRALDQSVLNGMLAPGEDSNGNFLGNGYSTFVQSVANMDPTDKSNRKAPFITFVALLSSAVHSVEINGVVER